MSQTPIRLADRLILVGTTNGDVLISRDTPLRRLNYFDGKFLRADDLRLEQSYLRALVAHSNQAGGSGIVHGFDVRLTGGGINLSPGLAIDPDGRVLLLGSPQAISIGELIDGVARIPQLHVRRKLLPAFDACEIVREPVSIEARDRVQLYVITISHVEALCGEEDVYGRLCEDACITDTARPYLLEGVLVRARPIALPIDFNRSHAVSLRVRTHLRSLAASAWYARERDQTENGVTGAGLRTGPWCDGADPAGGNDVPVALLARSGSTNLFLDAWTVRRERMEAPPRRYWSWRFRMRPFDVFLAQVLQFQCQLRSLFRVAVGEDPDDDGCQDERATIREAATSIEALKLALADLGDADRGLIRNVVPARSTTAFGEHMDRVLQIDASLRDVLSKRKIFRSRRLLINGGIIELPPAGYLPIDPTSTATIESQVHGYMGEGVDLRFCVAPTDNLAGEFESAQHMDRIDLLHGLDKPKERPHVDVIVPDGWFEDVRRAPQLLGYQFVMGMLPGAVRVTDDEFVPRPKPALIEKLDVNLIRFNVGTNITGLRPAARAAASVPTAMKAIFPTKVLKDLPTTMQVVGENSRTIGAGRLERRPNGGLFYMAGTAPADQAGDVLLRALESTVLGLREAESEDKPKSPAATPAGAAAWIAHFVTEANALARDAVPSAYAGTAPGKKTAADKRGRRAAPLAAAALSKVFTARAPYGMFTLPHYILPTSAQPGSGLWAKARIGDDPFDLLVGRSTDVELRVTIARGANAKNKVTGVFEVNLTGTLTVTAAPTTNGAITKVGFRFDGRVHIEVTRDNGQTMCIGLPMKRDLILERFDNGTDSALRLKLGMPGAIRLTLLAHWPATAMEGDLELLAGVDLGNSTLYFGGLAFKRNDQIFDTTNQFHLAGSSAIQFIANSLKEKEFARRELRNLFHPADDITSSRRVRTTRDWVLFRKRREVDCGGVAIAPTPPPAPPAYRRYMAYLATMSVNEFAKYKDQITQVITRTSVKQIGPVEFEADAGRITSDVPSFVSMYRAQGPGPHLLQGMIGGRAAAASDPDAIAKARVTSVGDAIKTTSQLPSYDPYRVDNALVNVLDPGSTEGVLLLITDLAVTTTKHEVLTFKDPSAAQMRELLANGIAAVTDPRHVYLGSISFDNAVPRPADVQAVRQRFTETFGPNRAINELLVLLPLSANAQSLQARNEERTQLATALGVAPGNAGIKPVPVIVPGSDATTFLT